MSEKCSSIDKRRNSRFSGWMLDYVQHNNIVEINNNASSCEIINNNEYDYFDDSNNVNEMIDDNASEEMLSDDYL